MEIPGGATASTILSAMTDQSGSIVDGYSLVSQLGRGGAGSVYRAMPERGGPAVALKLLDPVLARQKDMRERFQREARALNGLEHPHLIKIFDFGVHEGTPYLVTELLEGRPLDAMLAARPLAPPLAFELALGVVAGLAYAHTHGVLHRDIKPANVFVAKLQGGALHPKLLDFGLARFTDSTRWGSHATLTAEGAIMGTPTYMAPEQGFGSRTDARSDVYSAGILLFELLAARPPFESESRANLVRLHAITPPPRVADLRPGLVLQPALEALLGCALAKRSQERYPDASAMLRAMQEIPIPAARYV